MSLSIPYTFVAGTTIDPGQANANFKAISDYVNGLSIPSTPVSILNGGTGATTPAGAVANFGLAAAALITTLPLPIGQGGTGSTTIAAALAALGLTEAAEITAVPVPVSQGGTGGTDQATAEANLGYPSKFVDFVQNRVLANPGSQNILNGGLILKWGLANLPNSGGNTSSVAVNFAVNFPSTFFGAVGVAMGNLNSGAGGQPTIGIRSVGVAGFTLVGDSLGFASFNQTVQVFWVALGF